MCFITLFLFLGDTLFNTRGEPREAVVALSMLKEGNWILPINNGVDMAYKPPFFHWLIALFSLPIGHVTEYTSRLPSALALSVMTIATYKFFAKRSGQSVALLTAFILLTNFEVHRAGVACRVDMVLTCMMVLSLYQLYKWVENNMKGLPIWAILCLSGAFLSKGPVGAALPLLVVAIYALIKGKKLWIIVWHFAVLGVLSLIIPLAWYMAAYNEGGQRFLDLIYEENVLRLLGKMSYESHINPWYYNVMTVVTGFIPYTLVLLAAAFVVKWKKVFAKNKATFTNLKTFVAKVKNMDNAQLFALLSFAIIFVFYCIPKSKRSVYLLPIYPFLSFYIAQFMLWLKREHAVLLRGFGWLLVGIACLLTITYVCITLGIIPMSVMAHGKHAAENLAMLLAIRYTPLNFMQWIAFIMPLVGVYYFVLYRKQSPLVCTIVVVFSIFFALDGMYQPLVLNTKSDKPQADYIAQIAPKGKIYSYRTDVVPGNPLHPFTINFYLGDRIVPFEAAHPAEGLLLVGNDEITDWCKANPNYQVTLVRDFNHRSCDDHKLLKLYRFKQAVAN